MPLMQFARRPKPVWRFQPGRIYNYCGMCGIRNPPLFDVPTDVWMHYIEEAQRHQVVCISCWHWLTDIIDGSAYEAAHGAPLALWSPEWRIRHGIALDKPCHCPWIAIPSAAAVDLGVSVAPLMREYHPRPRRPLFPGWEDMHRSRRLNADEVSVGKLASDT